jgi:hypothetical protein
MNYLTTDNSVKVRNCYFTAAYCMHDEPQHRSGCVPIGEARGIKVGVKGRVRTGGGVSLPLGARGLCPRKNFQITDACR